MGRQFDELAKALASGVSRREALRRFAAGAVGGALAAVIPGRVAAQGGGNSLCAQWCQGQYPPGPERDRCVSASAKCPPGACSTLVFDDVDGGCFSPTSFKVECIKYCRKVAGGDVRIFRSCLKNSRDICPPGECQDFFKVNGVIVNGSTCVPV